MPKLSADELNDPVTLHVHRDYVTLNVNHTVGQALAELRRKQPSGRILYFYVVDDQKSLVGVVPTRPLLLSAEDRPLRELMNTKVITVPAEATVLEACEFFIMHKLLAFPVVDAQRRLVGVVDIDLYTREMADLERREGLEDLFQLIGVYTSQGPGGPITSFRERFPWLLTNIAGGLLAAWITGFFEAELNQVVALALFIPVVLALAESVAIQSVSLTLSFLHHGRPSWLDLVPRLSKESLTGLLLGLACGVVVGVVTLAWLGQPKVTYTVLGGISLGVTAAACLGVTIPAVLKLLHLEPRVAAGPIALAGADLVTLLAYFSLARWLLSGPV
ncbi:MAG: magnesium transporter [Gemmataceae bacterium]